MALGILTITIWSMRNCWYERQIVIFSKILEGKIHLSCNQQALKLEGKTEEQNHKHTMVCWIV